MKVLKNTILFFVLLIVTYGCQKDKTPPIIRIYSEVYNENQTMKGDTIFFDIRAEDEAGIKELSLLKDGEQLQKVSGDKLKYEWFTTYVDTGRHYFTIKATDNEGNQSEDYKWVYVNDITFVTVEGGTFLMGSEDGEDDAKPPHTVTLDSYEMMATEVTRGQFICFLNAINAPKDGVVNGIRYFYGMHLANHLDLDSPQYGVLRKEENCPVTMVTWRGAQVFAQWLVGKLPTEAEWEFAFRGGNQSQGFLYSGSDNIDEVGFVKYDPYYYNVATKKPNELGIYDMSGGLLEWCSDFYQADYYENSPELNPQGPETSSGGDDYTPKVLRGNAKHISESGCTYFNREKAHWEFSLTWEGSQTGFRIVKAIEK